MDARTSGPLTCDRVPAPAQDCVLTAAIDIPVADPITGRIVAGAPVREATTTSTAAENFEYTLPALDDPINPGLVPGLYTVRLSAPGYEPATTDVRVAQGQIAAAEPTVMQPLGLISGIVTYRTGAPATPTCVVVVPAGAANPTSCVVDTDGVLCTADGGPGQRCSVVADDGKLLGRRADPRLVSAVGVAHRPRIPDTPCRSPSNCALGSDFRYDPVINRYGRLTVTVERPNDDTGVLEPLPNATVTAVSDTGRPVEPVISGPDGVALLTGMNGGYLIKAVVDPNDPKSASAEKADVSVGLNDDKVLILVPTAPIGPFVGKVVVNVAGVESAVSGATVSITSAVYGYDGAVPLLGTATVETDANGCFAIVPPGTAPTDNLTSADCTDPVLAGSIGSIRDSSGNDVALVARRIVVSVSGTNILTFNSPGALTVVGTDAVKSLPKILVTARPVPIGDVKLTSASPLDTPDTGRVRAGNGDGGQPGSGIERNCGVSKFRRHLELA